MRKAHIVSLVIMILATMSAYSNVGAKTVPSSYSKASVRPWAVDSVTNMEPQTAGMGFIGTEEPSPPLYGAASEWLTDAKTAPGVASAPPGAVVTSGS